MSDETENGVCQSYPRPTTKSLGGDDNSQNPQPGSAAVRVIVEAGKNVALCAALSGISAAIAVFVLISQNNRMQEQRDAFQDMKTQYKLMERRYMDFEAYALMQGWKVPKDDEFGPTGNLERMQPKR